MEGRSGLTLARIIIAIVVFTLCTGTVGIFGSLVSNAISGIIGRVGIIPGTNAGLYGLVSGAIGGIVVGVLLATRGKGYDGKRLGAALASGYSLMVAVATVILVTSDGWAGSPFLLLTSPWGFIYVFFLGPVLPDFLKSIYVGGIGVAAVSGLINGALLYSLGLLLSRLGDGR